MTCLSLPGGIYPKAIQWGLEHNVGVSTGPLSQTQQRLQRDGGRWRADVTFPPLTSETGPLFAAYLDKASRGDMWTYLTPPHAEQRGNWGPHELVVNGDMTRDVSGWSAGSGASLIVNARRLRVKVAGSPGAVATAAQTGLATEADQPHVVMVDLVKGSTANWRVRIYPSGSPSQDEHISYYDDEGRVIFTHIPETTSTTLELACNSTTEQDYSYFANVSVARCLLVNNSLAVGNECDVKGGPTSQTGAIRAGEFVTIQLWNGWQMVRLTEDLDTDSSGNGTLRFEPALRAGVKGGGAVIVHKPFVRATIPAASSMHDVGLPHFHGFAVSYIEDVTEIGIEENPQDTDLIWYWDAHSYGLAPSIGTGTPTLANSGKTYFDKNGLLKTTALDASATGSPTPYEPAFDHVPNTGALRGLLIEEARTNLLLPSESFGSSWTLTNASVSADATTAPNGTTTADKLIESVASGFHVAGRALATAGSIQVLSVFAKAGERSRLELQLGNGSNGGIATFDLLTGRSVSGGGTITPCGDGWYLLSIIANPVTGNSNVNFLMNNGSSDSYTGDGTSGLYLWGAQLETGAFPTSYIPTTSATAARAADVGILAINQIAGFSQSAYTLCAEAIASSSSSNQYLLTLDDGTSNEIAAIRRVSQAELLVLDGGATQASIGGGTATAGAVVRMAGSFVVNEFVVSKDGGAITADVAGTMPTVTALNVGSRTAGSAQFWNGPIRRLAVFKTNKPSRQVRSLAA